MAYDNNTDKVTFIKKTGSEIISNDYKIDISSLLDSTSKLSSVLNDSDEIMIVRKFDSSSISPAITADEAWSAWVLPKNNSSGSTMYSLSGNDVTFSQTASDYTWTTIHSGRAADVALPALASGDTVYVLRKTYALQHLVTWTAGSKITSSNLNLFGDQFLNLSQELISMWQNIHSYHPAMGQPSGICPLDSSGLVPSTNMGGANVGDGLAGVGSVASPLVVDLDGDSLEFSSGNLKVATVDGLTSSSTSKPLSANQGKLLNESILTLTSGIVYKGGFDLVTKDAADLGTPVAGWTVGHTGSGITSHASWGSLTIANGNLVRYNGSAWQVAQSAASVLADGTIELSADWDAGSTRTISAKTQANTDSSTKLATTAWVRTHTGAASANMILTSIADVYVDDSTVAEGDMIYWDGNSWEPILLNDITPGSNKIITTGDSIEDLADVGSMTPGEGEVLTFSSGSWVSTDIGVTPSVVTCAGATPASDTATGADASTAVLAALNNVNLGSNVTLGMDTSVLSVLEFGGKTHFIGDGTAVASTVAPDFRKNVTIRNGTLKYNLGDNDDKILLNYESTTALSTTTSNSISMGTSKVSVASSTGYNVGDFIKIVADNDPATASDDDVHHVYVSNTAEGNRFYSQWIGEIARIEGNNIYLTHPMHVEFTSGAAVSRNGVGTSGQDQLKNITFENMHFEDYLTSETLLGSNPITLTSGSSNFTVTFPAGHGMSVGGAFQLQGVDASYGDGSTGYTTADPANSVEGDINDWFNITAVDGNEITAVLANSAVANTTGATGGTTAQLFISRHTGTRIKSGYNITFKNCTWNGFSRYAAEVRECKNVRFENCVFRNCFPENNTTASGAVRIIECDNVSFDNCRFERCVNGIFVATVASRVSSNIYIRKCYFNCGRPIWSSSANFISQKFEVSDCTFEAMRYRDDIAWMVKTGTNRLQWSCIQVYGAENTRIIGNDMSAQAEIPSGSDTFEQAPFWGAGNGWDRDDENKGAMHDKIPVNRGAIYLRTQNNRWNTYDRQFGSAGKTVIRENIIITWDSSPTVVIVPMWNTVVADQTTGQFDSTISIVNNNTHVQGEAYDIDMQYGSQLTNLHNCYGFTISGNKNKSTRAWKSIPGTVVATGDAPNTLRFLTLSTRASGGKGGRFVYGRITDNNSVFSHDDGIQINLGGVSGGESVVGVIHTVLITNNLLTNGLYGIYSIISTTAGRDLCAHCVLGENFFRSIKEEAHYNKDIFTNAASKNKDRNNYIT